MSKTRYFYDDNTEEIYTLSELEKFYNDLVASGDVDITEEPFNYYLDACTDKNGSLTEIIGNLKVVYTDTEGHETSIEFLIPQEALTVCRCLYNSINCYNAQVIDEKGNIIL